MLWQQMTTWLKRRQMEVSFSDRHRRGDLGDIDPRAVPDKVFSGNDLKATQAQFPLVYISTCRGVG
jgi:hypothetical protein